ncbi:MAG: ARMT1-like domain-containing protein, partial [Candidatus Omnitrophica bacterium]|nr:ARMT1-like domain-containing protein [Candidatus Omnitrophota bacterium]
MSRIKNKLFDLNPDSNRPAPGNPDNIAKGVGMSHQEVNNYIKQSDKVWLYGNTEQIKISDDRDYLDYRTGESIYIEEALRVIDNRGPPGLGNFIRNNLQIVGIIPPSSIPFLLSFEDKNHLQVMHVGLSRRAIYIPKGFYEVIKKDPILLASALVHEGYELQQWITAYQRSKKHGFKGTISGFRGRNSSTISSIHSQAHYYERIISGRSNFAKGSRLDEVIDNLINKYYSRATYRDPEEEAAELISVLFENHRAILERYVGEVMGVEDLKISGIREIFFVGEGAVKKVYRVSFDTNYGHRALGVRFIKNDDMKNVALAKREVGFFNYFYSLAPDLVIQIREFWEMEKLLKEESPEVAQRTRILLRDLGFWGVTFGEFVHGFTLDKIPEDNKIQVYRKNIELLLRGWLLTWDSRLGLRKGLGQTINDMKPENFIYSYRLNRVLFIDLDQAESCKFNQFLHMMLVYIADIRSYGTKTELGFINRRREVNREVIREVLVKGFTDVVGKEKTEELFKYFLSLNKANSAEGLIISAALEELIGSSYPATIPVSNGPDRLPANEEMNLVLASFGGLNALEARRIVLDNTNTVISPALASPAAVRNGILYINPNTLRGPPEQLKVIFEGHELAHLEGKNEEAARQYTLEYLIKNNLLVSHISFLLNNELSLTPDNDWLYYLKTENSAIRANYINGKSVGPDLFAPMGELNINPIISLKDKIKTVARRILPALFIVLISAGFLSGCSKQQDNPISVPEATVSDSSTSSLTVSSSVISIKDGKLFVGDEQYQIRGVTLSAVEKGQDRQDLILNLESVGGESAIKLMADAGINTVRTYVPPKEDLLNAFAEYDIKVIVGFPHYDDRFNQGPDIYNKGYIDYIKEYKDHSAILAWELGNEYNSLFREHPEYLALDSWWAELKEAVEEIHSIDPDHPVSTTLADMNLTTDVVEAETCGVDIIGLNCYRSDDYSGAVEDIKALTDLPLYFSEGGADSYNTNEGKDDQQEQAKAIVDIWNSIKDTDVLGITYMSWQDEWWKSGNLNSHDAGGSSFSVPYDNYGNEEYWGWVTVDGEPKEVLSEIFDLWGDVGVVDSDETSNPSITGTPKTVLQETEDGCLNVGLEDLKKYSGEGWASCALDLDNIDVSGYGFLRIDISGKAGDKVIVQMLDPTGSDVSASGRGPTCKLISDSQIIDIPLSDFGGTDLTRVRRIAIHYGEMAWLVKLNPKDADITVNAISFLPKDYDLSEIPESSAIVSGGMLEVLGWEFTKRRRKGRKNSPSSIALRNSLTPEEQSAADRVAGTFDPLQEGAAPVDSLQGYSGALAIVNNIHKISLEGYGTIELEAALNKFSIYYYQTTTRSPPNATVDSNNNRIIIFANSPVELTPELIAQILIHETVEFVLVNTYSLDKEESHQKAVESSVPDSLFILPEKKALALIQDSSDEIKKEKFFTYLAQTFEEGVFVTADGIRDSMPIWLRMIISYQDMMAILGELCKSGSLKHFARDNRPGYLLVNLGVFPTVSSVGEGIWGTLFYAGGVMGLADILTGGHWSFFPRNLRNQYLKDTYVGLSLGEQAVVDIFIEAYVKMTRTTLPQIYNKLPESLRERYEDDFIDTLLSAEGLAKFWQARCKLNGVSVNTPMDSEFVSSFAKFILHSREVKAVLSKLNNGFYGLRKNMRRITTYQQRDRLVTSLEKKMLGTIIGLLKIQFGQGLASVEMRIPLEQVKRSGFYEKMVIFYTEIFARVYEPLYANQPTFALYHSIEILRQSLFGQSDFLSKEKYLANEAALKIFPRLYNVFALVLGWNTPKSAEFNYNLKEKYLGNYINNIDAEATILYTNYTTYGELPEDVVNVLKGLGQEKTERYLPRLLLYRQALERLAIIGASANAMDLGDPGFQLESAKEGFDEQAWLLHKIEEIIIRGFKRNHLDAFFEILSGGLSSLLIMDNDSEEINDQLRPRIIILTDNAGETVLVMLLVKFLLELGFNVTIASRDTPVINDMTKEDTQKLLVRLRKMGYFTEYGFSRLDVISSGSRVFATPVATLSDDFLSRFHDDRTLCVIAMGQGNAESLWQMQVKKPFVHILMAKSPERIKEFVGIPKHSAMLIVNLPLPVSAEKILDEEAVLSSDAFCLVDRQDLVVVMNELGVTLINDRNIYIYSGEFENIEQFVNCFDAEGITLDASEGPIYLGRAKLGRDVFIKGKGGVVIRGEAIIGSGSYIENSSIIGVSINPGEKVIRRRIEMINGVQARFRRDEADSLFKTEVTLDGDISALSVNKPFLCGLLSQGVKILGNPESIYISQNVHIEKGAKIYSDVILSGNTTIGQNAEIGPHAFINNSGIAPNTKIVNSKLENCLIHHQAEVEGVELEDEEVYPYGGQDFSSRQISGFIIDPALNRGTMGILSVRLRRQEASKTYYSLIPTQAECNIGRIKKEYPRWYEALLKQVNESIKAARDLLVVLNKDRSISAELGDKIYAAIDMILEKGLLDSLTMAQAKGVIWQIIWLYAKSPFQLKKKIADKEALVSVQFLIGTLDHAVADSRQELVVKRLKLAMQFVALSNLNIFDRSRPVDLSDKLTLALGSFESVLQRVSCWEDVDKVSDFICASGYFSVDNSGSIIGYLLTIPEEERLSKNIIFNVDNAGEVVYSLVLIRELLKLGYRVIISANPRPIDDNYDLQDLQELLIHPVINSPEFLGGFLKEGKISVISNGSLNTGLDLTQTSRDFYLAATNKDTVMMFLVGYAVAKNILTQKLSLPAASLFWGKDTKVMQVEDLHIARGEAAIIFADKAAADEDIIPGGEAKDFDLRCYPLKVPLESRVWAEKKYGANIALNDIRVSGLEIDHNGVFTDNHYEVLSQRLRWLRQLLGRAPPELVSWRLVISTDIAFTKNVASCDTGRGTVYLHPYFFELAENKQTEILYHELVSHLAKGQRNEEKAMEDTRIFATDLELIPEAISGLIDNIRSRSEKREVIAYTGKIDELKDSGRKIIASWGANSVFKAVFGRALEWIVSDMREGFLPANDGVTKIVEYLLKENFLLAGETAFDSFAVVVSLEENSEIREQLSAIYGCPGFELKKDVFPDGETRLVITDKSALEGKSVILLQELGSDDNFVKLILAIGGMRDAGAREITCLFPENVLDNKIL